MLSMADKITVLFQTESHFPVNRDLVRQTIISALNGKVKRNTEVSVSIVGNRKMRKLNREYRSVDAPTDVLSFPLNESLSSSSAGFVDPPDKVLRLGDIIISYPMAVVEAGEQDKMVDDMITELALHGLDHLLGIHHPE
jgi:probable rRNA maturation factor